MTSGKKKKWNDQMIQRKIFIGKSDFTLKSVKKEKKYNLLIYRFSSAGFEVIWDVKVVGEDVTESKTPLEVRPLVYVSMGAHLRTQGTGKLIETSTGNTCSPLDLTCAGSGVKL